jgi:GTP-binding protein HflX
LIHLVDAANPRFMQQIQSVERILADLRLVSIPTLLVLNKSDLVDPSLLEAMVKQLSQEGSRQVVTVSALNAGSLRSLLEQTGSLLARDLAQPGQSRHLSQTVN